MPSSIKVVFLYVPQLYTSYAFEHLIAGGSGGCSGGGGEVIGDSQARNAQVEQDFTWVNLT